MIIIGEKLNGSIPSVAEAISKRDRGVIMERARQQERMGASYLDCCAATKTEEIEVLQWMISCVQEVTKLPVCIDSSSPWVLEAVYPSCRQPGIFNSISGEGRKAEQIFEIMAREKQKEWGVIALLMDDQGIPKTMDGRLQVFDRLMKQADFYGISPERIYIDPLVEMLCVSEEGMRMPLQLISEIRRRSETVHITAAVSNVSWHLPARSLINGAFAVLGMHAGLDSLILDPTDPQLMGLVLAANAVLGKDDFCLNFIEAYRSGKILG